MNINLEIKLHVMEYNKQLFEREEKKPNTMKCVALEEKARVREL